MKQKKSPKFLKVRCTDCGNEQFIYSHASTSIRCQVCSKTLAVPRGGKAEIRAAVIGTAE